jgi:hypothetical protein
MTGNISSIKGTGNSAIIKATYFAWIAPKLPNKNGLTEAYWKDFPNKIRKIEGKTEIKI